MSIFNAQTAEDVIRFLKMGVNVNKTDKYGRSPLYMACVNNNFEVVDTLLNNGANPFIYRIDIIGPIQIAARNGYVKIVERLLQAGVDINNNTMGTPLFYASQEGNIDVLDFLVSQGADIDFLSFLGTALMGACKNRQIDAVDRLLAAGANVNIKNPGEETALTLACYYGILPIVDRLLANGADINIYNSTMPPIIAAIESGSLEVLNRLVGMGADIDIRDIENRTALFYAIERKQLQMIKVLMDEGADKNNIGNIAYENSWELINEWLNIYDNTKCEDLIDIMGKLLILGVDVNYTDDVGEPVLIEAIKQSNIKNIKRLLDLGANIDIENAVRQTPLIGAVMQQNERIVLSLLQEGANINYRNEWGENAFMYAVETASIRIIELLLLNGANIYDVNNLEENILMIAINKTLSYHKEEIIEFLLQQGADVNYTDSSGISVLMYAIKNYKKNIMNLLLRYGADVNLVDNRNKTALMYAIGSASSVETLLDHGSDVNHQMDYGITPLMLACETEDVKTVKMLLYYKADVNLVDDDNKSALMYAVSYNDDEPSQKIVEKLLKAGAEIDHQMDYGVTSLMLAIRHKNENIVRILLEKGANIHLEDDDNNTALDYANESEDHDIIYILSNFE